MKTSKAPLIVIPNAVTISRLIAGPAYLISGTMPARGLVLVLLIAAAATDLVDGRVARALKVTSNIGGGLDTTADKVFALSLMLKLAESAVLPWWILAISLAQYLTLAAVGSIYSRRFHHIPVPEQSAHTAAVLAVAAVIVGVATINILWTTALAICLMLANLWHISVAWRRTASIQG